MGDLVAYGEIWRTGANNISTIKFSDQVSINNKLIPKGKYSLLTKPNKKSWNIYLLEYNEDERVLNIIKNWDDQIIISELNVPVIYKDKKIETFTIDINNISNNGADINLTWENTLIQIPVNVLSKQKVLASIKETINNKPSAYDLYNSASYFLQEGEDLNLAKKWINKAIEIDSTKYWMFRLQAVIHNKLNSIGLNSKIIPVIFSELEHHPAFNDDGFSADSRINVTTVWKGKNNAKSLILNGHVDVVPIGPEKLWDDDPFSGSIIDGKIYGRGSCDMKAGLSSGLFAISILKYLGFAPDGDIIFQSVVGEESGGCGTLTNIVKGYNADAAIILEPTSLKLSPIQSGALTFRLKVPGKATHASMRWDGISAIEKYSLIHQSIINFEKERHDSFDVEYYQSKEHFHKHVFYNNEEIIRYSKKIKDKRIVAHINFSDIINNNLSAILRQLQDGLETKITKSRAKIILDNWQLQNQKLF